MTTCGQKPTQERNVRACLMLLANIESRVAYEAQCLFDGNRELRLLLQEARDKAEALGLGATQRDAVLAALQQYPSREAFFDPALALRENRDFQELLSQIILCLPRAKGDKAEFRSRLHRYLEENSKREMKLAEKALTRVPL